MCLDKTLAASERIWPTAASVGYIGIIRVVHQRVDTRFVSLTLGYSLCCVCVTLLHFKPSQFVRLERLQHCYGHRAFLSRNLSSVGHTLPSLRRVMSARGFYTAVCSVCVSSLFLAQNGEPLTHSRVVLSQVSVTLDPQRYAIAFGPVSLRE